MRDSLHGGRREARWKCIRTLTAVIAEIHFVRERGLREKLRERDSEMFSQGVSSTFFNLRQIKLLSKNG